MRVPQVSDRIKEVPAQALRGVFAGIGQLLLITDKLRNKPPADASVPPARTPERAETADPAETAASTAVSEPAPAEPVAAEPVAAEPVAAEPVAEPAPATPVPAEAALTEVPTQTPADAPKPAKTRRPRDLSKTGNVRLIDDAAASAAPPVGAGAAGDEAGASPPLPNYDELSVASLRARLRNLDVAQVRQLAEYERAHAARADVIAMFDRRIVKLEAEA
jgi:hypothetical protein